MLYLNIQVSPEAKSPDFRSFRINIVSHDFNQFSERQKRHKHHIYNKKAPIFCAQKIEAFRYYFNKTNAEYRKSTTLKGRPKTL